MAIPPTPQRPEPEINLPTTVAAIKAIPPQDKSPANELPRRLEWFFNPTPTDWQGVKNPDSVTILLILDLPDDRPNVDDNSLRNLSRFPNAKTLVLDSRFVTDAGIKRILTMKRLEGLAISSCKITDDGIQQLKNLASIKTIGFFNTPITANGVKTLEEQLSKVHIELGHYNKRGKVFDHNGCLTTDFANKHLR